MAKATACNSTQTTSTSAIALLQRAGMRLQRQSNDQYVILWRRQEVCRDLTLREAAAFIDRALNR